ncbi:MAG: 50S ribosome-binding GTPase, partial [Chthoniobacterales bacterium]|nr:50S ribosome-binding GTPase [Chthoniobacterales bacterium]
YIEDTILNSINTLNDLVEKSRNSRFFVEGVKICIAGKTNAGKSSLLNRLLGFDRAIVSELPGTTRDTIEEAASLHGIPCLFTDTAGLRETIDPIEKEGVIRARKAIEKADLIVEIYDASHSTSPPALEFPPNIPRILCANKCDLLATDEKFSLPSEAVAISCLTGEGIAKLVEKIVHNLKFTIPDSANIRIAINARHKACLERALVSLNSAIKGLRQNLEPEFVAVELHSALHSIGNIVGTPDAEEILGEIFSQFCIGK